MSEEASAGSSRKVSLDLWAVALSLVVALLVRFNLLPAVKW